MADYYYSVGRVRALETRLLTEAQMSRLAAASNLETAFAVLSETVYAETLSKLKRSFDIEELASLELDALKDLMNHLAPGNEIISALFNRPDKDYYPKLKSICFQSPSPLIQNLVNHKIDLANIKTLLRTQALKKDKKFLENRLLGPGLIGKDTLLELFDKNPQDIISRLSFTVYFPFIAAGIDYYDQHESFYLLEKLMDDFVVNRFRKAKYLSSGIEPLVGFYLAKQAEIGTLRFILICKKNQVSSEQIKGRLRLAYA